MQSFFTWTPALLLLLSLASFQRGSAHGEYPKPLQSFDLDRAPGKALDARDADRRRLATEPDQAPLSWLMGSFFAYLYVGTPAQRVTVITDTGSHHTAFPCVGCACGKHMDSPYDPGRSSSAKVSKCGGGKCFMQQSYSEGSSWHAYEVEDRVWVGEESASHLSLSLSGPAGSSSALRGAAATSVFPPSKAGGRPAVGGREAVASNWSAPFKFGCQDKETGLFRTQEVDGIMGLSAHEATLPFVLHKSGVAPTKAFAMCMRAAGGVLTLGGVDESLHEAPVKWAALLNGRAGKSGLKNNGWYTVRLTDILLKPVDGPAKSLGISSNKFYAGKGTIVDSGTTDTYLPAEITRQWNALFAEMSGGMAYSNKMQQMSDADFARLPTLVYRLQAFDGKGTVDIESPPSAYTETVVLPNGGVRRTHRVYTTEGAGVVLGSNFMTGHNTIFDIDAGKIGFAPSTCMYTEHGAKPSSKIVRGDGSQLDQQMIAPWEQHAYTQAEKEAAAHTAVPVLVSNFGVGAAKPGEQPAALQYDFKVAGSFKAHLQAALVECGPAAAELQQACSARCTGTGGEGGQGTLVTGQQKWVYKECATDAQSYAKLVPTEDVQPCSFYCATAEREGKMTRGAAVNCLEIPWEECQSDCTQQRLAQGAEEALWAPLAWLGSVVSSLRGTSAESRDGTTSTGTCSLHQETRTCRSHRCPSKDGDWSVSAEIQVRMSEEEWSRTYATELLQALSMALHVPDSFMHLTRLKEGSDMGEQILRGTVKVRIPSIHYRTATPAVAARVTDALKSTDFARLVSRRGSVRAPAADGLGRWLLANTLSFNEVSSMQLREAKQAVVTAEQATSGINGLSSNYLHPSQWTKQTYRRAFIVVLLQIAAVSLFFVVRRYREIRHEMIPRGFDAFTGTEQRRNNKGGEEEARRRKKGRPVIV